MTRTFEIISSAVARFSKIASHLQSPFLLAVRLYWGWEATTPDAGTRPFVNALIASVYSLFLLACLEAVRIRFEFQRPAPT
jgi:hypothetical protein